MLTISGRKLHRNAASMFSEIAWSPIQPRTLSRILKGPSRDWVLLRICTIFIGSILVRSIASRFKAMLTLVDTPLEESIPALDEIRRAGKTKYIGLSECSASTLRKANSSQFLIHPPLILTLTINSCQDRRCPGRILGI
jgi:hypothetical protein